MSRNFELMSQLEIEAEASNRRTASRTDRGVVTPIAPTVSSHLGDTGGDEILRLVQRVFLSANGSAPRQVVFCGVDDRNGSSSVCASAGQTLAEKSGRPVCLVDANLRSPRLSSLFGVKEPPPFFDPSVTMREQCVKIGANLWLAGSYILAGNGAVLPPADQIKERLTQLRDAFDYLLVDAPGTSISGDAQLLGRVADASILVIEANSTRRLTARKAKETLDAAGVRLLGTVLQNRRFPIPARLYNRI